ncbi:Crp/Fnr family transcriptional regulator [Henriciella sp. AS95]|uniref:Crp/Fnr family transcriptional regulator n=1 Tax=Henriciella sp. AS95 TaxID=3135782 RepID=UPI00316F6A9F
MSRIFDFSIPALFDLLHEDAASALKAESTARNYKDGQIIHVQGENTECMNWVESGAIAFGNLTESDGFLQMVELGKGHHYGEFVYYECQPRKLSAQAIGPTVIREVQYQKFRALVEEFPEILKACFQVTSSKNTLLLEVYDDARHLPSAQRIAKMLVIISRGHRPNVALPFTQADLSTILGISKVTVNQTLKKLEDQKIIEVGYGFIRVLNIGRLRQFATLR